MTEKEKILKMLPVFQYNVHVNSFGCEEDCMMSFIPASNYEILAEEVQRMITEARIDQIKKCKIDKYIPEDVAITIHETDVANATIRVFNRWCDDRIEELTKQLEG